MYLLWHCARQGWVSKGGVTSTAVADAQEFDRAIAITRSRNSADHEGNRTILPVLKDDLT